jgi:hypothetical protein
MQSLSIYFVLLSLSLTSAWGQENLSEEINPEVREEFLHPHEKIDTEARESFFEERKKQEQQAQEFYPAREPEREIKSPSAPPIEE